MKEYKFIVNCLDYDGKTHKVKIVHSGADRQDAKEDAMIYVSRSPEFEKYAQVEMYGVKLIDNI